MAERFKYAGRQRKPMTIPLGSLPFLAMIYVLCFALDIVNLAGFEANPPAVAHFACSIWPWALVKLPDLYTASMGSVTDQCLGQLSATTVSQMFLSIKLTMGVVAVPLLWGYVALRPEWFLKAREVYQQRLIGTEEYNQELKEFAGRSFGMLTFLICWTLLTFVYVSDPPRRFAVTEKIIVEDGLAVIFPAAIFSISATAVAFIAFRRKGQT